MLNPELFIAFCLAAALLILIPGPVVTLVVATSLKHGTRTGLYSVAGASMGNAMLAICGAVGVTTLMTLLADLFEVIRWLGAAYLVWLGIKEWRAGAQPIGEDARAEAPLPAKGVFLQGLVIGITNPKAILFYIAFFPQFTDSALPAAPQLAAMVGAFILIGLAFDGMYALLAGRLRRFLTHGRGARWRSRLTGTLLIGTGIGLALTRR